MAACTCSFSLAEEAAVLVVLNDIQKFFDRSNYGIWLIAVPFHIGTLPKDLPIESALVVGRLGDGLFERLGFISPVRTDFEYLDALSADTECKVKLCTNMWRRAKASWLI